MIFHIFAQKINQNCVENYFDSIKQQGDNPIPRFKSNTHIVYMRCQKVIQ